jgi:hypothetical protein
MVRPSRSNKPVNDIDVIDPSLEDDYLDKTIYEGGTDESGTFTACYVTCGKCPENCCVVCASCGCGPVTKINQGEMGL